MTGKNGETYKHKIKVSQGDDSKEYTLSIVVPNEFLSEIKNLVVTPEGWTKGTVKIQIVPIENIYLSDKPYSFDDGETWQEEDSMEFETNGYVEARIKDIYNNISSKAEYEITNIDKEAPGVFLKPNGGKFEIDEGNSTKVNVAVTIDETASGVAVLKYGWSYSNEEKPTEFADFKEGDTISSTKWPGIYYLWLYTEDKAGNKNEYLVSLGYTVTKDGSTTPTIAQSLEVTPTAAIISIGETKEIHANVLPISVIDNSILWSSNNTEVAIVSSSGVVTGVAAGTATITASTLDGSNLSKNIEIGVLPVTGNLPKEDDTTIISVDGILFKNSSYEVAVGSTINAYVSFSPSNATNQTLKSCSSSNNLYATATVEGNSCVVKGIKSGNTIKITATSAEENKVATAEVKVISNEKKVVEIGYYSEGLAQWTTFTDDSCFLKTVGERYGAHCAYVTRFDRPDNSGLYWKFAGWYTSMDADGTKVTPDTIVTNEKSHILYARWRLTKRVVVTYDVNTGGACKGSSFSVDVGEKYWSGGVPICLPLSSVFEGGGKFVGWYSSTDEDAVQITPETVVTTFSDHTIYGKYVPYVPKS